MVDSPRNEGKDFFEINLQSGEIFTKIVFDREKQGAYALEVEARDGAPSARPNSNQQPNSGKQSSSSNLDFLQQKAVELAPHSQKVLRQIALSLEGALIKHIINYHNTSLKYVYIRVNDVWIVNNHGRAAVKYKADCLPNIYLHFV